ncbi:hypothetical protein BJY01DRAFT_208873 [Aspergillus pseudoustus]|uniref:Uncharacterized protein n=1 Tax=Aspergillus pseudoustus TaxID=1810923 RepID=A0ABR4KH07_9EURO
MIGCRGGTDPSAASPVTVLWGGSLALAQSWPLLGARRPTEAPVIGGQLRGLSRESHRGKASLPETEVTCRRS